MRCDPRAITDGYGAAFDRSSACKAGQKTVVVRTVDSVRMHGIVAGYRRS